MEKFNSNVNSRIGNNVKSTDIPAYELSKLLPEAIINIEREDENFNIEFKKAINNPSLKEADNGIISEFGNKDQYMGMRLGLPHG